MPKIEALYVEAEKLLKEQPSDTTGVIRQRFVQEVKRRGYDSPCHLTSVAVIDGGTGIFVRLTAVKDPMHEHTVEGPLLSVGKLYAHETQSPLLSNTAVQIWR
jgi:hypothetical protein